MFYSAEKYEGNPSLSINIRQIEEDVFRVIDSTTNLEIEKVERRRALFTLYEDAIFIYQGQTFLIQSIDRDKLIARARAIKCDYITTPWDKSEIIPFESSIEKSWNESPNMVVCFGRVEIKTLIFGYKKIDPLNRQILEKVHGLETCYKYSGFGMWIEGIISLY